MTGLIFDTGSSGPTRMHLRAEQWRRRKDGRSGGVSISYGMLHLAVALLSQSDANQGHVHVMSPIVMPSL
jgi:hypothetical protein